VPLSEREWLRIRVFGANVRRERARRGLTQEQLAERAEIATRNLQEIEAGKTNLRYTTASRIRLSLRCSWQRLEAGC
jgi:transcriptional regulator with XRE-family HTH domain